MFYKTIFLSILQQLFLQHAAPVFSICLRTQILYQLLCRADIYFFLFYRVVPHPACRLVEYHMLYDIHYAKMDPWDNPRIHSFLFYTNGNSSMSTVFFVVPGFPTRDCPFLSSTTTAFWAEVSSTRSVGKIAIA